MRRMRILHLITGLGRGGAERALFTLLTSGLQNGYENHVVALRGEDVYSKKLRENGIQVTCLGVSSNPLSLIAALAKLRKICREILPDCIHGWMYHANIVAVVLGLSIGCRVLWNIRNALYDLAYERFSTRCIIVMHRYFGRYVDSIVYNSRLSQMQHQVFGIYGRSSVVIPNGFDVRLWHPSDQIKSDLRSRLDIPQDALVVGHVARFHPMKDHLTFIRAIQKLMRSSQKIFVVFIGKDVGLENPHLHEALAALPLDQVRFLGDSDAVALMMPSFDVFCLSSWSEAFPNVLGEAMACGVPCVATDVGDCGYILGDEGWVVPPRNAEALSSVLGDVLALSRADRVAKGMTGRKRIAEKFSLESTVKAYTCLYSSQQPSSR